MVKPTLSPEEIPAVRANLFHAAHKSVGEWDKFQWHPSGPLGRCDAHVRHSSQALCIDLFGTLQQVDPATRDAVLGKIAKRIGVPPDGPWEISLEWRDTGNLLRETGAQTQVDAMAESPYAVILFEAKFCESDGGSCSQTRPYKGIIQCNGNYESQTNRLNQKVGFCALSEKGIRYWEVVPKIMSMEASRLHKPCPFAGPWYQWMRNLVLAKEYAVSRNKVAAVTIVYADHSGLPFPGILRGSNWSEFVGNLKTDQIKLATLTYQEFCQLGTEVESSDQETLVMLQRWIIAKIEDVGNSRVKLRNAA